MKNILLLSLLLLLLSCKENSNKIPIDLSKHVPEIYFSEFADSISYLTLDMRDSCLISEVDQIYKDSNLIFVKDRRRNGIFIFDENNRYKNRINYYGRGPGEFIRLSTACINPTDKQIGIYDSFSRKILIYSYEGKFIKEVFVNDYVLDFTFTSNKGFIFIYPSYMTPKERSGLWLTDSNGIFVKHLYHLNPEHKASMFFYFSYTPQLDHNQGILYYDRWADRLLQVNQDSSKCIYEFDLREKIPESLKKDPDFRLEEHFLSTCFFNMPNYFLACYASINNRYWVLFNKKDHSIKVATKLINDIDDIKVETFPCFLDENTLAFELQDDENNYDIRLLLLHAKQ